MATIPLSGTDWCIHEDADGQGVARKMFNADPTAAGWLPATVPGNIQADLEAGGCFEFDATKAQAKRPLRLRLHTADQSKDIATVVEVQINGKVFEHTLPKGLGLQSAEPARLAFSATAEFKIAPNGLRDGKKLGGNPGQKRRLVHLGCAGVCGNAEPRDVTQHVIHEITTIRSENLYLYETEPLIDSFDATGAGDCAADPFIRCG